MSALSAALPIQSAFVLYIGRQVTSALRRTIGFDMQYRTSDVAENLGKYLIMQNVQPRGKTLNLF